MREKLISADFSFGLFSVKKQCHYANKMSFDLNFHEDMSLVTEKSAIIVNELWRLVKQMKKQASLKMLPGITK